MKHVFFLIIVILKIIVRTIRAFKKTPSYIDYKWVYNRLLCIFKVVIQNGIRTDVQRSVPLNVKEAVTLSMDPVYMDVLTHMDSQLTVSVKCLKYFNFYVKEWKFTGFVYLTKCRQWLILTMKNSQNKVLNLNL